jgi:hypothetical protein
LIKKILDNRLSWVYRRAAFKIKLWEVNKMGELKVVKGQVFDQIGVQDVVVAEMNERALQLKIEDVNDKVMEKEVHDLRMVFVKTRTSVVKHGEMKRAAAVKYSKDVIAEQKRIIDLLAVGESHLDAEENKVKEAREAIKREKERLEELRIQGRRDRLAGLGIGFNGQVWQFAGTAIPDLIVRVQTDEQFEETLSELQNIVSAEQVRVAAELQAKKEEEDRLAQQKADQEAEAKRLEEAARKIAEQEEALRAERDRSLREQEEWEAARASEAKALADAKQKAIDDEARAVEIEKARQEAALKAIRDLEEKQKREEEAAKAKIEKDRIAAERKAARQPDKVKILQVAQILDAIQTPEVKSEDGKAVALWVMTEIQQLIKEINEKVEEL